MQICNHPARASALKSDVVMQEDLHTSSFVYPCVHAQTQHSSTLVLSTCRGEINETFNTFTERNPKEKIMKPIRLK